uniref:TIP41-like protein n=1 Tax=Rhizophora mucronata TaxID=61149 RepID=A0A2P2JKC0_RHIMU
MKVPIDDHMYTCNLFPHNHCVRLVSCLNELCVNRQEKKEANDCGQIYGFNCPVLSIVSVSVILDEAYGLNTNKNAVIGQASVYEKHRIKWCGCTYKFT